MPANDGSVQTPNPKDIVFKEENLKKPSAESPPTKPMTPLPIGALAAIGVALFTNSLIITVLFPFAPLIVEYFQVTSDEADVGYYAGMLASCFFLGSMISGPIWGKISDIIGRKTVMIMGLTGNAIFSLVFGLSTNFVMAVASRFVLGLVCSVLVVSKTSITELCDDTNVGQGFSVYGLCWGLGLITGPLVGGFLVEPATQYPAIFSADGFFGTHPFFLPELVISILTVFGIILSLMFITETLGQIKPGLATTKPNGEKDLKVSPDWLEEGVKKDGSTHAIEVVAKEEEEEDPGLFGALIGNRETLMCLLILCIAGFMFTGFEELFSLWALTDWEYGGLGFSSSNVGLAEGAAGLTLIPVTLILYPWLISKLGAIGALQCSLFTGIFQALIPCLRLFGFSKLVLQIACMITFAIRSFNETGMAAMFILYNNSIRHPKYLGVLNGIQTTALSTFQACAPWLMGCMFAWSLNVNTFPIDYHFAWFFLGFMHVVALIVTFWLPPEVNHRKMLGGGAPPAH